MGPRFFCGVLGLLASVGLQKNGSQGLPLLAKSQSRLTTNL
jgi:hypothetical protein